MNGRRGSRGAIRLSLASVIVLASLSPVVRSSPSPQTPPSVSAVDDAAISARVNALMGSRMVGDGIPGAALVVVLDGRVIIKSGYGVSDLRTRTPVDPDATVFGIASVGKVVTAMAVLQQVGEGRLALEDPVERHWSLSDPATALRVWHLLTHTGGFGEQTVGASARDTSDLLSLADYVEAEQPPFARAAGLTTSYSNYGFSLAGAIVESTSGQSFEDYVDERIFRAIGMTSSSFSQPLPSALQDRRATAYEVAATDPIPLAPIYFNDRPASAMFTTAGDMGRLIEALLDPTVEPKLLGRPLTETLFARRFSNHPDLPGVALGMYESDSLGHRTLAQGGDWQNYSAQLFLFPAARLGMFAAFNSGNGNEAAEDLWLEVVKHAIRDAEPLGVAGKPLADWGNLSRFAGRYRLNRYSRHTLARLGALVGAVPEFEVSWDGAQLSLFGSPLTPVGDGVMERGDTGTQVAFRAGPDGVASHLMFAGAPVVAYERLRRWEYAQLHQIALVLLLITLAAALWKEVRRPWPSGNWGWRGAIVGSVAANLIYLIAILAVVGLADPWAFQYGVPGLVLVVLWSSYLLPVSATVLTGASLRPSSWEPIDIGRRTAALYALLAWGLALFLNYWRILGVRI